MLSTNEEDIKLIANGMRLFHFALKEGVTVDIDMIKQLEHKEPAEIVIEKVSQIKQKSSKRRRITVSSTPSREATPKPTSSSTRSSRALRSKKVRKVATECPNCQSEKLRVVPSMMDPDTNLLECMRRSCLATVQSTDLPVGTVFGEDVEEFLAQRPPQALNYPSQKDIERCLEHIRKSPGVPLKMDDLIEREADGSFYLNVPHTDTHLKIN